MKLSKKLSVMLPILFMTTSCSELTLFKTKNIKVLNFDYAYKKGADKNKLEQLDKDIYIAHLKDDIYVEVPSDFNGKTCKVEKTDTITYFMVYHTEEVVSNQGYKYYVKETKNSNDSSNTSSSSK